MTFQYTQLPPDVAARLAADRELLRGLRARIARRIERDMLILDALCPDADLEADHVTSERATDGSLYSLGRSSDDEPSLCGIGGHEPFGHTPGYPVSGGRCGDDVTDIEGDEADAEYGGDDEPSLGSLNNTLRVVFGEDGVGNLHAYDGADQRRWSSGGADDLEAGDDNGIADVGGQAEQYGAVFFGAVDELCPITGRPITEAARLQILGRRA